jgi:phosphoadenosine phosphosulfate reductase
MSTALFDPIKTQSKITDSVIVAFSGGKESCVVMDLCYRYFKNVKPFFMYICPNLSFQERTLEWYEKKYQTEIIRLPHMDVSEFFHYGSFRPADESFPIVSINDIYRYVRIKTDIWWIAAGERINDSIVRRAMMKKSGSIDDQRGRLYPVAMWNKHEVLDYIKFHNLYLGADSRKLGFSFKSLWGKELVMLKKYFPEDYEKVIKQYPFAEAGVLREEVYGEKQISGV